MPQPEHKINKKLLTIALVLLLPAIAMASETDGTIDTTNKYAWGENTGWVNFRAQDGNIHVTDSAVTGYAWDANYGWINFAPDQSGVMNDGAGNLSGFAWSAGGGWIDFSSVTINSSGQFTGIASGSVYGRLTFDCDNCNVTTDWWPASARSSDSGSASVPVGNGAPIGLGGGGGGATPPNTPPPASINPPAGSRPEANPPAQDDTGSFWSNLFHNLIPDFLEPKPEPPPPPPKPIAVFDSGWDLIDFGPPNRFVLAPLPTQLTDLTNKYEELGKIFTTLGVNKFVDLDKLRGAEISLPSISDLENLPSEILVAHVGGGDVPVNSSIALQENGSIEQKIETTANTTLRLAVRPGAPVDSVMGYLIFREAASKTVAEFPLTSQTAAAIFALGGASKKVSGSAQAVPSRELLVATFSYEDSDRDGVYTAEVQTPAVAGTYEVITLIHYTDRLLGTKELRLVTVVDPEGYVYELIAGKEARVPNVEVAIYNADTDELWDALSYNQTNPQKTDASGKYSFLVPEGDYYITAEGRGYRPYRSADFSVREGSGIHFNIELQGLGWLSSLNASSVLLILLILLISSAFAGYAVHEHALKRRLIDEIKHYH